MAVVAVGHGVLVSVPVEVQQRPGTHRAGEGSLPEGVAFEVVAEGDVIEAPLHALLAEGAVALVEEQRVGPPLPGKAHARGDEEVQVAVVVQVAVLSAPGPERLEPRSLALVLEVAAPVVHQQRVAVDHDAVLRQRLEQHQVLGAEVVVEEPEGRGVAHGRADVLEREVHVHPHVRVHVDDEDVQVQIVVVVEDRHAHGAVARVRAALAGLVDEAGAAMVHQDGVLAVHVGDHQIGEAVPVEVSRRHVAAPARVVQAHRLALVDEAPVPLVAVEAVSLPLLQPVVQAQAGAGEVAALGIFLPRGELAHVDHVQIEIPIVVCVEEGRRAAVADVSQPCPHGVVFEGAVAPVAQQQVAAPVRGDEQVGVAVVVHVGEAAP